ncbi:MAG: ATP-binding protein [Cyclobacteriaceae bacterium]|nr:ATP-binding protein [Cyclobacteriaceae bacterium]
MTFKDSLRRTKTGVFTNWTEDDRTEFKKSLQLSGESISKSYLKTICGFANNKGGRIVYGIDPDNSQLLGIKETFENLDNKYFSTGIKDGIDGSIDFKFFTKRYGAILIGVLEVKQAESKPVILKTNFDNDGEKGIAGEIYFRYNALTTKIQAPDLRALIDGEINKGTKKVLNQINKVIEAGPNTAILNTTTGEIDTNGTTKIIIDPETLKNLNLIREGSFDEKEGAPAYVIKGQLEIESTTKTIIEKTIQKAIHSNDLYDSFIKQECSLPEAHFKEIVFQSSHYYPCYFFISKWGKDRKSAIQYLESLKDPELKNSTRKDLIKRLEGKIAIKPLGSIIRKITESDFDNVITIKPKYGLKGRVDKTIIRSISFNSLNKLKPLPTQIIKDYLKETIEAFSFLDKDFVLTNKAFLLTELKKVRDELTVDDSAEKSIFKKTVCLLDEYLHS